MKEKRFYVYIATNKNNKILYIGVTSSLIRRNYQHRNKIFKNSFTAKYNIDKIVYFEIYSDIIMAIEREKQLKAGSRQKKIDLVRTINPKWRDLVEDIESGQEVEDGNKNVK